MDKQENAWVQLSLHEQDLCLVKTSFILSYLHKRRKWTSMQNKPECQYKNQTLQRVFVLCECTWGLGLLQKESTYCTILFPFLLLGFGLLRWETKLALVFEIQTFHSFFFSPLLSFPDFTSPPDIRDTILQLQLGLRVVSHYQLPKNWAHCLMTKQLHLSNLQRTPMFSPKKMHTFRFWKY